MPHGEFEAAHSIPPQPPFPHYPSPRTKLASLVKGRWIDGKVQTVALLLSAYDTPPFLYCKLICRQDGGIAAPTLTQTNLSKTALSPRPAPTLTIPTNNSTQIHRYTTKRLSIKKRATGTFFEDNKATIYKFRETFYLAKSFPDPSKIRFVKRFRFLRKAI